MKINLLLTLFILITALFGGCDLNQSDEKSNFEPGYYLLHGEGKIDLFRNNSLIGVIFENNITTEVADSIIRIYKLMPIKMFDNTPYQINWEEIDEGVVIVMKLPDNSNINDYLSTFPRISNKKFGDLPEVKFCLPIFAFDNSGNPGTRFIINDEIVISSKTDSLNTLKIIEPYNLEFVRISLGGQYIVRITHHSPANNLTISNMLYNHSEFNWSVPDSYANLWH